MSYYQLPDKINKNVPKIQLNLPPDEKARDLMEHLLYFAQMNDPIFQNKVEDLIKNKEDLQAYLLATEDLNRTLSESVQLAVGHGKINDVVKVRHLSEKKRSQISVF